MSEKVVSITNGVPIIAEDAREANVIATLELALEQAKRGELVGIGLIKVRANMGVGTTWWVGDVPGRGHLLTAGCAYLAYELAKSSDQPG